EDLGGFAVLLKETDHAWLTTFTSKRGRSAVSCARDFCARNTSLAGETHHSCMQGLRFEYKSAAAGELSRRTGSSGVIGARCKEKGCDTRSPLRCLWPVVSDRNKGRNSSRNTGCSSGAFAAVAAGRGLRRTRGGPFPARRGSLRPRVAKAGRR